VHPLRLDGRPAKVGFTIVVHVVSEYQSGGLLLGTQQQVLWGMETSYKTGLKTITAPVAHGGAEFTFPFSATSDGAPIGPQTVRSVTLGGSELAPSDLTSAAPATSPDQGSATVTADDDDDDDNDDNTSPAEEEFFDCDELTEPAITAPELDELIEPAVAAMVTGEAGDFDSAWLQSTPSVSIAGTAEELDHFDALTDSLVKAADGCEPDSDGTVKTVGAPKDIPLSNVRKRLLKKRLVKTKPRLRSRIASHGKTAGVAGYALLATLVWAATIAVAVAGGVVPHAVHTLDHAAPLHSPAECASVAPRWSEVREPPPPDLDDPMVRQEQWHCYSAPSNPDLNGSAPEVGAWADWQRALPDDFEGRATKPFTLKEINATVNRVHAHPMFDTAVCAKADAHCPPPDIAAVVWDELKLSNNPKLCTDPKLRESALAMVEEVVDAFHKPAPLLRPILKKDGTPVQVHVHTVDEIPLSSRMYRVSPDRLPAMRDKLNEMLEQGVIRRSHSSWSSPLELMASRSGGARWICGS
jgi:hypothetical protein